MVELTRRTLLSATAAGVAGSLPRRDELRSDLSTNPETAWKFDPDRFTATESDPTVVNGLVYIGGKTGVYAIDAESGEQDWICDAPTDEVWSSPAVSNRTVFIGSLDGTLYAIEATSGDVRWQFSTSNSIYGSPTVGEDTVYVGNQDGNLYAVNTEDGSLVWSSTGPDGDLYSSPTVANGRVFVGSDDTTLYAFDAASGDEAWTYSRPDGEIWSSPTVRNNTVVVGCDDSNIYGVYADTGTKRWTFTEESNHIRSSPTATDGTVFIGGASGTLYAIDLASGTAQWRYEFTDPTEIRASVTVVGDQLIVPVTVNPDNVGPNENPPADVGLNGIRRSTQSQLWSTDGDPGSPVVLDGTAYIRNQGSVDTSIDAVNVPISGSSSGSRVSLQTLNHHGVGQNWEPTATYTFAPENPEPGTAVTFDASTARDDGKIVSYTWEFGDESNRETSGVRVEHTFSSAGRYTVTLTVTDNEGASQAATKQITVGSPQTTTDSTTTTRETNTTANTANQSETTSTTQSGTTDSGGTQTTLRDTDGDGVPDKYDYAPRDPDVQSKEDTNGLSEVFSPGFGPVSTIIGGLLGTGTWLWFRDETDEED